MKTRFQRGGAAVLFALAFAASTHAQALVGFDGAAPAVVEFTGPAGACGYPTGPVLGAFPTAAPFICPIAGPAPLPLGDVAVDRIADTVFVTDGVIITEYTAAGAPVNGFIVAGLGIVPGPLTGLGYDPLAGMLWITDGVFAAGILPPPPPGCAAPLVAVPAFPLAAAGLVTDIAWDPLTGSLFMCDLGGAITNVFPGGAPGPFGAFPAAAGGCFGVAPGLQGIAVDTSGPPGVLYVTDGLVVSYLLAVGAPAPPTFYSSAPCSATPALLNGLAFTARPINYGTGADTTGLLPPVAGAIGQSWSGNGGFALTLTGSVPGSFARALYSVGGPLCPAVPVLGLPLLIAPPINRLGTVPVSAVGFATVPASLATVPPGISVFTQWVAITPVPSLQVSNGLEFTTTLP